MHNFPPYKEVKFTIIKKFCKKFKETYLREEGWWGAVLPNIIDGLHNSLFYNKKGAMT